MWACRLSLGRVTLATTIITRARQNGRCRLGNFGVASASSSDGVPFFAEVLVIAFAALYTNGQNSVDLNCWDLMQKLELLGSLTAASFLPSRVTVCHLRANHSGHFRINGGEFNFLTNHPIRSPL